MISKTFDDIGAADVARLVGDAQAEHRSLEYKERLPDNSEKDRHEFPADVSSFANAAGGDLFFGIQDRRDANGKATGIAEKVVGLETTNLGSEILRLEQMCRSSIQPRINGLRIKAIDGLPEGPVIMVRIGSSWIGPHMVTYNNSSRFYSRDTGGKYQMDLAQIRASILRSESLPDRIRAFRAERLAKIVADETPLPLTSPHRIVLHVGHLAAFDSRMAVNFIDLPAARLPPVHHSGFNHHLNFDGLLTYTPVGSKCGSYTQLFRNGMIEAVEARLLEQNGSDKPYIPSVAYEAKLIEALRAYFPLLRNLGVDPPWFVMLSLIGVRGYRLGAAAFASDETPIDRDMLVVPEVISEDGLAEPHFLLHPAFDAIWQAGGLHESYNYDDDGNWVGQRR